MIYFSVVGGYATVLYFFGGGDWMRKEAFGLFVIFLGKPVRCLSGECDSRHQTHRNGPARPGELPVLN